MFQAPPWAVLPEGRMLARGTDLGLRMPLCAFLIGCGDVSLPRTDPACLIPHPQSEVVVPQPVFGAEEMGPAVPQELRRAGS